MNNILVVRNDKIGDLILTLPALKALRKSYPKARISILIKPYTLEILYKNPDIDEVLLDRGDFWGLSSAIHSLFHPLPCRRCYLPPAGDRDKGLFKEIKDRRFDIAIILYPTWKNALLCFLSRIPVRVGTGYKPVGILFNKRVYVHRTKVIHHESDYCLKLVYAPIRGAETMFVYKFMSFSISKEKGEQKIVGKKYIRNYNHL